MDHRTKLQQQIDLLTAEIDENPSAEGHIARGKLHYQAAEFDTALNDFIRARQLEPDNTEAGEYIRMVSEIFEFRYKDLYNP